MNKLLQTFAAHILLKTFEYYKVIFNFLVIVKVRTVYAGSISVQMLLPDRLPEVSSFKNLGRLCVQDCHSLKYLFCFITVRSFVQLKYLSVRKCKIMKEVLVIKEVGKEGRKKETTILFP